MGTESTLVISDLHAPFEHPDAFEFVQAIDEEYGPFDNYVCIGDEADMHAVSDHDHDPDGLSAGDELKAARKHLRKWYDEYPDVYVCVSNHTARPFRRAFKYGIPKEFLKSYGEFLEAPTGWQWADKWKIDGVLYEHGEGVSGINGARKSAAENMQNTVIGHIHAHAGIQYIANPLALVFGMNVGCLIDKDAYAFAYGRNHKAKPVIGCGLVQSGVPTFVPMQLKKGGRWTGKL